MLTELPLVVVELHYAIFQGQFVLYRPSQSKMIAEDIPWVAWLSS